MIKEFKEFIAKGNVLDMAVGVILGASFKAIIDSLVGDILTPLLNVFLGGVDFSDWVIGIGPVHLAMGNFLNTIISFLIIAWILFLIVRAANRLHHEPQQVSLPTTKICPYCKSEVPIDASRCPHCTSELEVTEEAQA